MVYRATPFSRTSENRPYNRFMPTPRKNGTATLDFGSESLGGRLARMRTERGYTQIELAESIGITQKLVSDYERQRVRPAIDVIVRYAKLFEVSTDELLGVATKRRATPAIKSQRVLRRLKKIDGLSKRDQDALIRTIDNFLKGASK